MSVKSKSLAAALCLSLPFVPSIAQEQEAEIVVTATRQPTRANELLSDVTVLNRTEIEEAGPTTSLGQLLARQPGIEISSRGNPGTATSIYIRGTSDKQAVVLVDGVRIGSATLGAPNWAYLPLQQIDRIEILRGASSSLYGADAVGGVIQIFTRKGEGPLRFNGEAGAGSHSTTAASAGLSGSTEQWRYSLQMANYHTQGFSAIGNRKNYAYNPDKDGHRNTSASGNLSFSPTSKHEFGVHFLHSDGWNDYDANQGGNARASYRQDQKLSSYGVYSRNQLTSIWHSTLKLGKSIDDSRQFTDDRRTSKIKTDQTQYQWQNDINLPVGIALLSIERLEQKVSGDQDYDVNRRAINSFLAGWTGNLGANRFQFNLRQDRNSQFGTKNTGFAAYGYQFTPTLRASASYSTAFNAPTFNDLYWPYSGNRDLKPETARNREVSLHYETGGHSTSLTAYRNDVDDMIAWAPESPGSWNWIPKNIASARLQGLTLTYSGTVADFNVKASADIQDPRDRDVDKILRYRARRHASFSIGRQHGKFDWTAELQASSKRYQDVANTQSLAGYGVVNLQANYGLDKDWSIFARANNIFDRDYELVQDYNTPGATVFLGIRYSPR